MRKREAKRRGIGPTLAGTVVSALALAIVAPLALAETSREDYRAAVEPICKRNTRANKRILKGVRAKVQRGRLKPAGRQFSRAAVVLRKALRQIGAVPRPAADALRVRRWLSRLKTQAALLGKIGEALRTKRRRRAEVLSVKLTSGARLTNAIVAPFGFNHCRLEPSKFT